MRLGAVAGLGAIVLAATASLRAAELTRLQVHAPLELGAEPFVVTLTCTLGIGPRETTVPVSFLGVSGTRIEDLTVTSRGTELEVVLGERGLPQARGIVKLAKEPTSSERTEVEIEVQYRVSGAIERRDTDKLVATVPIVILGDASEGSHPERFRATVELPSGHHLTETFPTGFSRSGNGSRYEVELPIVPAFLTLRAQEHETLFTTPVLVDLATLTFLASLGALGVHRLRRQISAR